MEEEENYDELSKYYSRIGDIFDEKEIQTKRILIDLMNDYHIQLEKNGITEPNLVKQELIKLIENIKI